MGNFELATTKEFDGVDFNCYIENNNSKDFWATREQIGELLGYATPGISIGKIHQRNKERLDKFSRVSQIDLPSGGVQKVTIYSFRGLLEICRYSNQPKADAVMDFLYDIADEIRRTGSYSVKKTPHERKKKALNEGEEVMNWLNETFFSNVIKVNSDDVIFLNHD